MKSDHNYTIDIDGLNKKFNNDSRDIVEDHEKEYINYELDNGNAEYNEQINEIASITFDNIQTFKISKMNFIIDQNFSFDIDGLNNKLNNDSRDIGEEIHLITGNSESSGNTQKYKRKHEKGNIYYKLDNGDDINLESNASNKIINTHSDSVVVICKDDNINLSSISEKVQEKGTKSLKKKKKDKEKYMNIPRESDNLIPNELRMKENINNANMYTSETSFIEEVEKKSKMKHKQKEKFEENPSDIDEINACYRTTNVFFDNCEMNQNTDNYYYKRKHKKDTENYYDVVSPKKKKKDSSEVTVGHTSGECNIISYSNEEQANCNEQNNKIVNIMFDNSQVLTKSKKKHKKDSFLVDIDELNDKLDNESRDSSEKVDNSESIGYPKMYKRKHKKDSQIIDSSYDKEYMHFGLLDYNEDPVPFKIPQLHIFESVVNLTEKQKDFLQNVSIKTGPFTWKEDEIIKRNFIDFTKNYDVADPIYLLGIGSQRKGSGRLQFLKAKHFYVRLAKDLNDRTLSNVYKRARIILHPNRNVRKLTEKKIKNLRKVRKLVTKKWHQIDETVRKTPESCKEKYRYHEKDITKKKFKEKPRDNSQKGELIVDNSESIGYPKKHKRKSKNNSQIIDSSYDKEYMNVESLDYNEDPVPFKIPRLHIFESVHTLTEKQKDFLQNISIKTGPFTCKEDEIIKRNFKDFTKKYDVADPVYLLGIGSQKKGSERLKFLKAKHFYVRLAKDLNDRTLSNVYKRARIILHPNRDMRKLTEKEIKNLKKVRKLVTNKWHQIGETVGKTPESCKEIYRYHKKDITKGKFTVKEKAQLIKALKKVSGQDDISCGSIKGISWKKVASYIPTKNSSQCRLYWANNLA